MKHQSAVSVWRGGPRGCTYPGSPSPASEAGAWCWPLLRHPAPQQEDRVGQADMEQEHLTLMGDNKEHRAAGSSLRKSRSFQSLKRQWVFSSQKNGGFDESLWETQSRAKRGVSPGLPATWEEPEPGRWDHLGSSGGEGLTRRGDSRGQRLRPFPWELPLWGPQDPETPGSRGVGIKGLPSNLQISRAASSPVTPGTSTSPPALDQMGVKVNSHIDPPKQVCAAPPSLDACRAQPG